MQKGEKNCCWKGKYSHSQWFGKKGVSIYLYQDAIEVKDSTALVIYALELYA